MVLEETPGSHLGVYVGAGEFDHQAVKTSWSKSNMLGAGGGGGGAKSEAS